MSKKKSEIKEIDIIYLDKMIQTRLRDTTDLDPLKHRLKELDEIDIKNIPENIKQDITKNRQEIFDRINKIKTGDSYNQYLTETMGTIEEYKSMLQVPLKTSFVKKKQKHDPRKDVLIQRFLNIAQKYMPDIKFNSNFKGGNGRKSQVLCLFCNTELHHNNDDGMYTCQICGFQQEMEAGVVVSYKDADRINVSTKYVYDRKIRFRECIDQYQGTQNCTIDQKIYSDLEDIMEKHHLLGDKNSPREIRFSKISKDHIVMFLKELKNIKKEPKNFYTKHYENVNLIHFIMTGKRPDNIAHIKDRLLADFDLIVETYDTHFKGKIDRVNFISSQNILYQLLQKYHHPCKKEDFMILKTIMIKQELDDILHEIFNILGWPYVPLC